MVIGKKYVFLLINFMMIAGIMFGVTDFFLGGLGNKFRYVFILYCLVDIISHKKILCSWNILLLFSLLIFYVLAWGFVFINPIVAAETAAHRKLMMIYLAILIPSALEVIHYKCVKEYALSSITAVGLVLVLQVISHRNELILDPIFAIRSFLSHEMVRASFGYMDTNFVGNSCFAVLSLLFMVYFFHLRNPLFHSRIRILMVLTGFVFFLYPIEYFIPNPDDMLDCFCRRSGCD